MGERVSTISRKRYIKTPASMKLLQVLAGRMKKGDSESVGTKTYMTYRMLEKSP